MSRRRSPPGFTLIELVVASSLSTIALLGLFAIMGSMVQTEVDAMRNGTVTAWSLASINAMSADIASASYISYPTQGNSANYMYVCTNWSANGGGPGVPGIVDKNQWVTYYYYCYDTTDAPTSPFYHTILRLYGTIGSGPCPTPASSSSCTSALGGASVVATGVYNYNSSGVARNIFTAESENIVHVQFNVGNPMPGISEGGNTNTKTSLANPVTMPFDTRISLESAPTQ